MNKTTILAVTIIVLSGLIGATPFILDQTSINVHEENFNTSVTVVNATANNTSLGLNADRDLNFGEIPQGSNATKFLNMSTGKKSLLTMSTEGNISEFLVPEDHLYFEGSRQIELEMKGREPGNYTGNVSLRFEIPENQAGVRWLDLKYWFYSKL